MEIIENGTLFDENLRHPISAYYCHNDHPDGFSMLLSALFGFNLGML